LAIQLMEDELLAMRLEEEPEPEQQVVSYNELSCPICMEKRPFFEVSPCGHGICVRCAVKYVRSALSNAKEQVRAEGIRCTVPGCTSFITPDILRRLVRESNDNDLARTSTFEGPITLPEVDRFDTFVIEASVPFAQKMYCPRCERLAIFEAAPGELVSCPYCQNQWNHKAQTGQDQATADVIQASSRACPNCDQRITHYHGHGCHHIAPGTGCPNCKQHFCYVCLRKHGQPGTRQWHADCEHRQSFCNAGDILQHLVNQPFPHDKRCGCPICPDCRPQKPCPQCTGNCVVCRGAVPHSSM